tara:strand:- start:439 stop:828 length:390 start_codon:yes stop_codon:yes gene_type:complete
MKAKANPLTIEGKVASCLNVSIIFKKWVELRKKSGAKRTPRLTTKREQEIATALKNYGFDDIIMVLNFLLSNDNYAIWMRENNYTLFENIFRKWNDKLKRARHHLSVSPVKEEKQEFFIPFSIVDGVKE